MDYFVKNDTCFPLLIWSKLVIKIFFVLILLAAGTQLQAQTKPVVKYKVPKLFTQLGGFRDSVSVSVQEAENIIGQPLLIFDDKKGR